MATEAQLRAQAKYDKYNTRAVLFKLNLTTDADILARLDAVENRQGYIKALIRKDMRGEEGILDIDAIRTLLLPIVKKYNIKRLYLFGSYARGEAREDSDIDLMIEERDTQGMISFVAIQEAMEERLKKKVDLVEHDAVMKNDTRAGKRFREHVERDMVLLLKKLLI